MNLERGLVAEDIVIHLLEGRGLDVKRHKTHGIDLKVNDRINIEVKSCKSLVKDKNKVRKGKFSFYPKDLERADLFSFVVFYRDISKVYFVDAETINNYFKHHKKKTKLSMTLNTFHNKIRKNSVRTE